MRDRHGAIEAGRDYVGVGVGAMVFDGAGKVFLAKRGPAARNEVGRWEFPGGGVEFGERMEHAIRRELQEEHGIDIEVRELLGIFDHILPEEGQHWVSATYLASYAGGVPVIKEVGKCAEIGWFSLQEIPSPLTLISEQNVAEFSRKHPDGWSLAGCSADNRLSADLGLLRWLALKRAFFCRFPHVFMSHHLRVRL